MPPLFFISGDRHLDGWQVTITGLGCGTEMARVHWQEQSKGLPRTILGGLFYRTPPAEGAQKAEGDKDGSNKDTLPRMQVWINEDVKG